MPGEKPCEVLLLYRKRSPANAFLHRALSFYFLLSYTIPPLRHFPASGVLLPKKPCNPAQRLV